MSQFFSALLDVKCRKTLIDLLKYLEQYSTTLTLTFHEETIEFQTKNSALTCMVTGVITSQFFNSYTGNGQISTNITFLLKILKNITDDNVTFFYDSQGAKLNITSISDTFVLSCFEHDDETFQIPEDQLKLMRSVTTDRDETMFSFFQTLKNWKQDFKAEIVSIEIGSEIKITSATDIVLASKSFDPNCMVDEEEESWKGSFYISNLIHLQYLHPNTRYFKYIHNGVEGFPVMFLDSFENVSISTFIAPMVDDN